MNRNSNIVVGKEMKSMDDLVAELHEVFSEDVVDVEYVKSLLASYKSKANDWKKYVNFDTYRYTRNLVDEGNGKFNLMLLCWGEGHSSSIHDHSDSHCFVKILDGQLKETLYDWPSDSEAPKAVKRGFGNDPSPMKQNKTLCYAKEQVTYINDSIGLHRVENPSHSDKAVSLHLYSPPFGTCNLFDERTGRKTNVRMTFWSTNGQIDLTNHLWYF